VSEPEVGFFEELKLGSGLATGQKRRAAGPATEAIRPLRPEGLGALHLAVARSNV
jgi:hypothetical protein